MDGNFVAGAERIGIYLRGDLCPGEILDSGFNHSIGYNTVYAAHSGVVNLPTWSNLALANINCTKVAGFTVFIFI